MTFDPTRRALLKAAAVIVPASAGATSCTNRSAAATLEDLQPGYAQATYLDTAELRFVNAAVARLIPADELGPGALEAGVPLFIDRQLSGPFGRAETWYMQGPWRDGTQQQGYQLRFTPAQLYRVGIADVDDYCRRTFGGKAFAQLDPETQDRVLHGLDQDQIKLARVHAKHFFEMLWQNTHEGFLADPMYGGNRNFAGWRLIGFPGPRYNYVNEIDQYGKRYDMPPVSILGRSTGNGAKP